MNLQKLFYFKIYKGWCARDISPGSACCQNKGGNCSSTWNGSTEHLIRNCPKLFRIFFSGCWLPYPYVGYKNHTNGNMCTLTRYVKRCMRYNVRKTVCTISHMAHHWHLLTFYLTLSFTVILPSFHSHTTERYWVQINIGYKVIEHVQTQKLKQVLYLKLTKLAKVWSLKDEHAASRLVKIMILPILDYKSLVYKLATSQDKNKIQKLQNNMATR